MMVDGRWKMGGRWEIPRRHGDGGGGGWARYTTEGVTFRQCEGNRSGVVGGPVCRQDRGAGG